MVTLCAHRPEGFGPKSTLHPHLPTTCFLDVIVVPLATWVYLLLALFILLPLSIIARKRTRQRSTDVTYKSPDEGYANDPYGNEHLAHPVQNGARRRTCLGTTGMILYYFLIIALIAMVSLEIARLAVSGLGIGLLPFTYAGIIIATLLHVLDSRHRRRPDGDTSGRKSAAALVRVGNALFWLLLIVVMAIKIATYVMEGLHSRDTRAPEDMYKVSDEVIDVAVMVGVEVGLLVLELVGA